MVGEEHASRVRVHELLHRDADSRFPIDPQALAIREGGGGVGGSIDFPNGSDQVFVRAHVEQRRVLPGEAGFLVVLTYSRRADGDRATEVCHDFLQSRERFGIPPHHRLHS